MRNVISMGGLIVVALTAMAVTSVAHSDKDHEDLRHWEIASDDPDRIFLSFYADPATSRAVSWRTAKDRRAKPCAEIGKALGGPGFINNLTRLEAKTVTVDMDYYHGNEQGDVNYHSVIFENLEPETLYAYRVGDGDERWSEWIQFRTASREKKPFSFVYFGDAQNDVLSHWSRTIRMAYQTAPKASFALHAGDLINRAHSDVEWAGWFKAGGFLHAQWSGVPVTGNHEYRKDKKKKEDILSLQWRPQFTLPVVSELPKELHETVYTVEYQGAQLIVLNSNELLEEQTDYLEKQLKKPGYDWRFVTFHHSIHSPRRGYSSSDPKVTHWQPLIEKYNVDLVLQGHDHSYTRGQTPVRKGSGFVKDSFQTMYVTTVSGPKQYALNAEHMKAFPKTGLKTLRNGEQTQFFQVISIDGNELTYQAYTSTGELYDEALITKNLKSGAKTIKQNVPDVEVRTFKNTPGTENSHE